MIFILIPDNQYVILLTPNPQNLTPNYCPKKTL
jgi:hypothetical protein